jgi:phosphoribosylamine--glycine ligase
MAKVEERIIRPTVDGLQAEGTDYRGFIFFGLMNVGGDPYVIEYNARLGDPESEVILPRIESDLFDLLDGVARRDLAKRTLVTDSGTAVTVMIVAGGYPDSYEKGTPIGGTDTVKESLVFHAGTRVADGRLVTAGGRVLAVTSRGATMEEALARSYRSISGIYFEGMNYRRDIGFDLKARTK